MIEFPSELTVGALSQPSPNYCGGYTKKLQAMYRGGRTLFELACFDELFPRHRRERDEVYAERKRRAVYTPYAGEIIDHLVASIFQQPLTMERSDDASVDEYYKDIVDDISPPGGERCSLNALLKEQTLTAFIKKTAYTLVDLPRATTQAFSTRQDQELAGALNAYAVPLANESIIDWEEGSNRELHWVRIFDESMPCASPIAPRNKVLKTWTIYTRDAWQRYALEHDRGGTVSPTDKARAVDGGVHTFGAVPIARLDLTDGLWAMEKLFGLSKEMLNKSSALSWAEYQSLFPQFYELLHAQNESTGVVVGSPEAARAVDQPRGQGYVQIRDARDKPMFVGPDTSAFEHSGKSIASLRDEMHRVTHTMSLTLDNNAAALRRSADSKAHDRAEKCVIFNTVGQLVRDHARDIFDLISAVRGDVMPGHWQPCGMDKFDATDVVGIITNAVDMATMDIPSKTHKVLTALAVSRAFHGEDLGEATFTKIEEELIANIHDESGVGPIDG